MKLEANDQKMVVKLLQASKRTEALLNKARADSERLHKANHLAWEAYTKMLHRKRERDRHET